MVPRLDAHRTAIRGSCGPIADQDGACRKHIGEPRPVRMAAYRLGDEPAQIDRSGHLDDVAIGAGRGLRGRPVPQRDLSAW